MQDTAKTRNKNRKLLMGEVAKEAPSNVDKLQSGSAAEEQSAQQGQANEAVRLFDGSGGNSEVSGRVLASQSPRFAAGAQLAGFGGARRELAMQADRTNASIDANNWALTRRLGLVPGQMNVAANSGAGLAMLGQGLGAAGNGVLGGSIWSAAPAAANAAGNTYNDPYATRYAGATDIRRNPNVA